MVLNLFLVTVADADGSCSHVSPLVIDFNVEEMGLTDTSTYSNFNCLAVAIYALCSARCSSYFLVVAFLKPEVVKRMQDRESVSKKDRPADIWATCKEVSVQRWLLSLLGSIQTDFRSLRPWHSIAHLLIFQSYSFLSSPNYFVELDGAFLI